MKTLIATLMTSTMLLTGGLAHAAKNCTDEPKSKWMSIEEFKKQKKAEGYKIRKFKQPGTCYEIYGTDKDGNDVEIYFNPVDGSIVKKK
ncbi:MAG: PepSY domain-containing protein [Bdellovibrionales bacterium]|nr:PepSY domain-containing protein [Bdellovibrionales bacterium]